MATTLKEILDRARAAQARLPVANASALFGAAVRLAVSRGAPVWPESLAIENNGTLRLIIIPKGKLPAGYCAPENPSKEDGEAASVFAAGVLGFEIITAASPSPALVQSLELDVPSGPVISRATAADPKKRFQSLREMLVQLEQIHPPEPPERERGLLRALAAGQLEHASEEDAAQKDYESTLSFMRGPSEEDDEIDAAVDRARTDPFLRRPIIAAQPPPGPKSFPWASASPAFNDLAAIPSEAMPPPPTPIPSMPPRPVEAGEREVPQKPERTPTFTAQPLRPRPPPPPVESEAEPQIPIGPRTIPGAKARAAMESDTDVAEWSEFTSPEGGERAAVDWAGHADAANRESLLAIERKFEVEKSERQALADQIAEMSAVLRKDFNERLQTRSAVIDESIHSLAKGRDEILSRVSGLDDLRKEVLGRVSQVDESLKSMAASVEALRKDAGSRPKEKEVERRTGNRFAMAWSRALASGEAGQPERDALTSAEDLVKSGLLAEATASLEAAHKKLPHSVALLLALAQARLEIGDRPGARSHFQNAARLAPGSMEAQMGMMATATPSRTPMVAAGLAAVASGIAAAAVVIFAARDRAPAPAPPVAAPVVAAVSVPAAPSPPIIPTTPPPVAVAAVTPPPVPAPAPAAVAEQIAPAPAVAAAVPAKVAAKPKKIAEVAQGASAERSVKKGEDDLRSGKMEAAFTAFNAALRDSPQLPAAHRGLAMVLMMQGKDKAAKHEYETYLQLAPKAPDANHIKQLIAGM